MIVVGLGWQKTALAADALDLVVRSLNMVEAGRCDYVAAPAFKQGNLLPQTVADAWGARVLWINKDLLQQEQARCQTFSATVKGLVGLASIAEACALAGAGKGAEARLCLPRQIFYGVTCAVAKGERK